MYQILSFWVGTLILLLSQLVVTTGACHDPLVLLDSSMFFHQWEISLDKVTVFQGIHWAPLSHDPCRSKECEHSGPGTSHLGLGGEAVLAAFEQSYGHRMESDMGYHGMGVPHFSDNQWLPNCDELTDPGCLFFTCFVVAAEESRAEETLLLCETFRVASRRGKAAGGC